VPTVFNLVDEFSVRERNAALLAEAARERQFRAAAPEGPSAFRRLASRLGSLMIRVGERLAQEPDRASDLAGAR
jgi:hypothetical protein